MNKSLNAILSLSWQSVAYGVGILGSQLIVYLMLPFLTRFMSREAYGVVTVITALYAFLNTLTNAGLPAATYRFYNDTHSEQDRKLTLGGSQFLFFLFAAIPAACILIFPGAASRLLLGSAQYAVVLQVVACFLIFDTLNTFGTIILRIQVRPFVSSIHSIILIACKTGLALLFVIKFDLGVLGYWLGFLIGEFIGLIIMVWLVRKRIFFKLSWNRIWDLLKFGLPLLPATLSTTMLKLADRYFIGSMAGLDQVAVYDVGYKAGSIILILIMPFRAAWAPFSFSIAHKPEAPRIYRDVLTYLIAGCSFLILGVYAFRHQIIRILAPITYYGAADVVGWVAVSQLFFTVYLVFSVGPMIRKKTHHLAWIAMCASGANLVLNFVLIPSMGIVGAAVATFAGYGLLAILTYFMARRSFDMQIDWSRMKRLGAAILVVALLIVASEQLEIYPWMEMGIKVIGLLSFPALLLLTKFVSPTQTKELLDMGKNVIGRKLPSKRAKADKYNESV